MSRTLLRYGAKPSIYNYPDDEGFIESVMIELEPREKDQGSLSFWEYEGESGLERLVAASASTSSKLDKKNLLHLDRDALHELGFVVTEDPDPATWACIAGAHRGVPLGAESERFKLASWLRRELALEQGRARFTSISKDKVARMISAQYKTCDEAVVRSLASEWALALCRSASTQTL